MRRLLLGALLLSFAGAGAQTPALSATATLRDSSGQVLGTAKLTQLGARVGQGVRVDLSVRGLAPSGHGLHVHEHGDCAPGVDPLENQVVPFGAAGGHFDPGMSDNHAGPEVGDKLGHAGDLPMLTVGADGAGQASFVTQKISLSGEDGVLGRALMIHADPDDYTSDPGGDSGERVGCGVIARPGLNTRDYALPGAQTYPEGVAYDAARKVLFTGSAATGDIYAVNAASGAVSLFSKGGAQGRATALGLLVDPVGRLWVAGGASGTLSVLSRDGAPVATLKTPASPRPYLNALTLAGGAVYVTDSTRPVLWRARGANPETGDLEPWLDLTKTPIRYGPGLNLNGIVSTPAGRYLLSVQSNTGDLWRIDTRSKAVSKVMGGLNNGDGVLLDGRTLYAVRNADGVIAKVRLSDDFARGQLVAEEPLNGLRFPTTLAALEGDLVITQGQLNQLQGGTPETPFKLTRFKKF